MSNQIKGGKGFYRSSAVVAAAILAATLLTLIVPPLRSGGGMYFLFLTAIVFSSLQGSYREGLFAAVLSVTACLIISLVNQNSFLVMSEWLVLLSFGLASVFTILLCHTKVSAENARLEAERKYRMIFEDAITGIYETTVDGKYAEANPQLARMFGFESSEQLITEAENLNIRFYADKERRRKFSDLVNEKGNISQFESEIYRRDGSKIWISENAVAVRDKTGKLIGFQGTTIEITDRKSAQSALENARHELEEKVVARTVELQQANEILRAEVAERERIEKELLASQKELRDLSAHLESIREEERKYIARELHDELGQTLTALKIDLTKMGEKMPNFKDAKIRSQILERIPAMIEIVDTAMETTRKIVSALRPGVLDELGLAAAAEWLVREFLKLTAIKCELKLDFDDDGLPQNIKTAMFRILQECLTNITRHAAADKVLIELKNAGDFLLLTVEDNGCGIGKNKLQTTKSFGVAGMRERAFLLDGTFEISRPEKGGTRISVKIPRRIDESFQSEKVGFPEVKL